MIGSQTAKALKQAATKIKGEVQNLRTSLPNRKVHTPKYVSQAKDTLDKILKLELLQDKLIACAELWSNPASVPALQRLPKSRAELERMIDDQDEYVLSLGNPAAGQMTEADKLMVMEWDLVSHKIMGYWPTPPDVVKRMVELANITIPEGEHRYFIDPSAGKGNIAAVIREHFAGSNITMHCVEIDRRLAEFMRLKGYTVFNQDTFEYGKENRHYADYVFCNPPFEKGQDIKHIQFYFDTFLTSTGTLVAICGEGAFRDDAFKAWVNQYGFDVKLPAGAFKDSERSTGVAMRIIVVSKGVKPVKPLNADPPPPPEPKRFSLSHNLYDMKILEIQHVETTATLNASLSSLFSEGMGSPEEIISEMQIARERLVKQAHKMAAALGLRLEHRGFSIGQKVRNTETGKESVIRELADDVVYVNERIVPHRKDKNEDTDDQYPAWAYELLGEPKPRETFKMYLSPSCATCETLRNLLPAELSGDKRICWSCYHAALIKSVPVATTDVAPVCDKCGHSTDLILSDAPAGQRLCWDCLKLEQQVALKLSTDATALDLAGKIDRCKAIMAQTKPIWNKPFEAPGVFDTGGSNRPKSLDCMVDAENKRRSEAFARYQQAEKDLAFYQSRLAAYEAGEVHANGQRKANAPSRVREELGKAEYAQFIQATVKVGDQVALTQNLNNHVTIKRLNRKTITTASGTIWEYNEITPLIDGKAMTNDQLKTALKAFFEATPESVTDVLPESAEVSEQPLPPYTIGQVIENTPWRSPDSKKDAGWKPYKVLGLRPGGVQIDLGNNELWVKAENCREITCDRCNQPNKLVSPHLPAGQRICWECAERLPTHCKGCGREFSLAEAEQNIPCWKCQEIADHYQQIQAEGSEKVRASGIELNERVLIEWGFKPSEYATVKAFGEQNPAWVTVETDAPDSGCFSISINSLTRLKATIEAAGTSPTLPPIRPVTVKDTVKRVPEPLPEQLRLF